MRNGSKFKSEKAKYLCVRGLKRLVELKNGEQVLGCKDCNHLGGKTNKDGRIE